MKLALYDDYRLGIVKGEQIIDAEPLVAEKKYPCQDSMMYVIEHYDELKPALQELEASAQGKALAEVKLQAPVPKPGKIVAAPVNYQKHKAEMSLDKTIDDYGLFLKANSSIIGPGDTVELPFTDRRTDHELELGFVIGKKAKRVKAADALSYVFGYLCLCDVTVRGGEDRSTRKSFDTFTPIGPWIVTADEFGDPGNVDMVLTVNGEVRQKANTRDLIFDVPRLIEYASNVFTLFPGDVFATGTPEGVAPIEDGDVIVLDIERIGQLTVNVKDRD